MTFLLRSSLTNLGFICSFARHCRQNNACLLCKVVWSCLVKYAIPELGIYFLVAITSSLYLCLDQRYQWLIFWWHVLLVVKIGTSASMNKALCSCFSFHKGEKKNMLLHKLFVMFAVLLFLPWPHCVVAKSSWLLCNPNLEKAKEDVFWCSWRSSGLFLLMEALLHCALCCMSLSQILVLEAVLSEGNSCFHVGLIFWQFTCPD